MHVNDNSLNNLKS